MQKKFAKGILELVQGDITKEKVDAIVNAANRALAGGGGVDGAIHSAGGPAIMEECRRIGECPTGQTVMTTGGKLPAGKVLHTVGPIWKGGNADEAKLLASCYNTALAIAHDEGFRSIAFPSISTGIYGYPLDKAAPIALSTIMEFMLKNDLPELVRMVLFDDKTHRAYSLALQSLPESV